jgi:hypothetical protein
VRAPTGGPLTLLSHAEKFRMCRVKGENSETDSTVHMPETFRHFGTSEGSSKAQDTEWPTPRHQMATHVALVRSTVSHRGTTVRSHRLENRHLRLQHRQLTR